MILKKILFNINEQYIKNTYDILNSLLKSTENISYETETEGWIQ